MKQWQKQEDGFTLIEMIITVAISAILVGSAVAAFGYISAGNAKRSASRFNARLSTAQTETMMKKDPVYMYLYKDGKGPKVVLSKNDYSSASALVGAVNAHTETVTEVGGSGVDVVAATETGSTDPAKTYTLSDISNNMIKIAFDKATGAYKCVNSGASGDSRFFVEIRFSGRENYTVTLVQKTGKHVLNK